MLNVSSDLEELVVFQYFNSFNLYKSINMKILYKYNLNLNKSNLYISSKTKLNTTIERKADMK